MIIDDLKNKEKYYSLNEYFKDAFEFISEAMNSGPDEGEYEINGKDVYAIVSSSEGKGKENARLEAHRKYIDIQVALSGVDVIGWRHLSECGNAEIQYDNKKDIEFFGCGPEIWTEIKGGTFCLFFPHDAHAPQAGEGFCKKIVVKINAGLSPVI